MFRGLSPSPAWSAVLLRAAVDLQRTVGASVLFNARLPGATQNTLEEFARGW